MNGDVLETCAVCGKPTMRRFKMPLADTGFMEVRVMCDCDQAAEQEHKAERERRERIAMIERLRGASLMESRYRNVRFAAFMETSENAEALRRAKWYVDHIKEMRDKGRGLLFYGPVGTGKTYTAACIANELLDKGVPVIMTSFVKILQEVQGNMEHEAALMRAVGEVDLVIFDDFGAERRTDWAYEKIYNFIDTRVRAMKPMILTTNLALTEMRDATDTRYKRLYDRVLGSCFPVSINGRSFRIKEAARMYDEMTAEGGV